MSDNKFTSDDVAITQNSIESEIKTKAQQKLTVLRLNCLIATHPAGQIMGFRKFLIDNAPAKCLEEYDNTVKKHMDYLHSEILSQTPEEKISRKKDSIIAGVFLVFPWIFGLYFLVSKLFF